MSQLQKLQQTIVNQTLEFQQLMLPSSDATLTEKGMAFQELNQHIKYLTETILQDLGEERVLDRGNPWFIPQNHPHIFAVRLQTDEGFRAWQVQEPRDNTTTIATYTHIPDKKERLHIKVELREPESNQTSTQILNLELKYPIPKKQEYELLKDVIIYRVNNNTSEKQQTLVNNHEIIDISNCAVMWIGNPHKKLFT